MKTLFAASALEPSDFLQGIGGMIIVTVTVILFVLAIFICIVWLRFPFMVKERMDTLIKSAATISKQLSSIDTGLEVLRASAAPVAPIPAPKPIAATHAAITPDPGNVLCNCLKCGKPVQFNPEGFDPDNAPIITCPHCGKQTKLYLPEAMPA